jgi:hypothetical protein
MPRLPAAVRHVAGYRLAFAVTALTAVIASASAATAAGFATATTSTAVRQAVAPQSVRVTAPATLASSAADDRQVTRTLRAASRGLPLAISVSSWSQPMNLPPGGPAGAQAQAQLISLPGVAGHARLVSGQWPPGAASDPGSGPASPGTGAGQAVPACVPEASARLLGLAAGQTLTLRASVSGTALRVRISCVFAPRAPRGSYWGLSPLGGAALSRSAGFTSYGPLVTTAAVMGAGQVPVAARAWVAVPETGRITAGNLAGLGSQLAGADASLANSIGAVVSSGLPGTLQSLGTGVAVARSQLLLGLLILLVIAGVTLVVAIRLLDSQRAGEAPLLMARGASRRQLARRGAAEALVLAVPAAVIGPLIAGLAVPLLTRLGPLAAAGITLAPGRPADSWVVAAAVAAGSGLIIALPWLRPAASPLRQRAGRSRPQVIAATAAAGADLALIAIAAVAGWQLTRGPSAAPAGLTAATGVDPVLALAPVLALSAGTLVLLRLLPLAARLADRGAARGRGLTFAGAAWQLSRKPVQQGGPALLAVLAVATAVLALATASSSGQSATAQAYFSVGASRRVTLLPSQTLPVGQVAAVTGAAGVTASTPAFREQASLPPNSSLATVLALDGPAASRIVPAATLAALGPAATTGPRPANGGATAAALLRRLGRAAPAGGTVLPGRPAAIALSARLTAPGAGSPELFVQLTDAAGVGYLLDAGPLPADGRAQELRVPIGTGADYPLRLRGFSLQYQMPLARPAAATLTIGSVHAVAGPGGSAAGGSLPGGSLALPGHALVPSVSGVAVGARTTIPRITAARQAGPSLVVTFGTGSGTAVGPQGGTAGATLTVSAGPRLRAVPGIATRAFLAATGNRLGSTIAVPVQGTTVPVVLTGEVTRFPTVSGPGGGVVVDQAALQDMLLQAGIPPAGVGEWWLRTAGTAPALRGLPGGTSVSSATAVAAGLRAQPLPAAGQEELLAVAVVALVLAGAGFAVGVAAGRQRDRDTALLDALGARRGQIAVQLGLEQAMLALPAAAAGLLLGTLLSHLIIPAASLTAAAARPVPPVAVHVPLLAAAAVAVVIAAVPPAAAALAGLRRLRAASALRVETET